mgnify:CR=1 FL=1
MNEVTCKDCCNNQASWFARNFGNSIWWKCGLEENYEPKEFNPVDGKTRGGYYKGCSDARGKYGACGVEAKHWTPRRKQDLFIFLKRV